MCQAPVQTFERWDRGEEATPPRASASVRGLVPRVTKRLQRLWGRSGWSHASSSHAGLLAAAWVVCAEEQHLPGPDANEDA